MGEIFSSLIISLESDRMKRCRPYNIQSLYDQQTNKRSFVELQKRLSIYTAVYSVQALTFSPLHHSQRRLSTVESFTEKNRVNLLNEMLTGIYFACIMLMCSMSMVFTVLVLNLHHRCPDTHTMPTWVSHGIISTDEMNCLLASLLLWKYGRPLWTYPVTYNAL